MTTFRRWKCSHWRPMTLVCDAVTKPDARIEFLPTRNQTNYLVFDPVISHMAARYSRAGTWPCTALLCVRRVLVGIRSMSALVSLSHESVYETLSFVTGICISQRSPSRGSIGGISPDRRWAASGRVPGRRYRLG